MAFSELEERISKIRQQNEEIKRRYEEVEEDKKNAAKSNALVQMVPSTVWPERKEPPEYSNPPKVNHKQKSATKEQSEHVQQHHPNERRKGEGPPPDPKYNFLADAEREEYSAPNNQRDSTGNKNHNRSTRGNFKKRGMGKEGPQRGRTYHGTHRDEHKPEYEAWRKERNRIDEDRISRQKTAEGNWRREWDNDKAHLVNEISKGEGKATLGDFSKKDGRYSDGSGYASHNRGAYHKSHRGSPRNFHNNSDYSHMDLYDMPNFYKTTTPISVDERTVVATDKSIKVTLNQSNLTKGPVMSVKVNSPSIAGTGRVGPRQRTRVTYSSHSDIDTNIYESGSFSRQKSFEDKTKGNHYNNVQRTLSLRKPQSQKKKENGAKSPFSQRKEFKKETSFANSSKHYENGSQSNFVRKEYKDSQKSHYPPKSPRTLHKNIKILKDDSADVMIDNTIKDEKKEAVVVLEDNDVFIESEKIDIESPNEIKDDECIVENESKSDIKEENDIIFENSEYSPCEEEMINENIELNQDDDDVNVVSETNQDDVNIISETNQDNVHIFEDKREKTNKDNIVVPSETQDINNDIENNMNDENKKMDNLIITIDNAATSSCNSDNNTTSTFKCISQIEDTKTDELIQDCVSNMTNDEKSKESSERDDSDQNNDQNDIVAMNSEKVSEIMIETCSEEALHPPIDKSVMALEENDVTHHNNEVPIEKSELSVSNLSDQSTTENTEGRSSISIDNISSSSVDIAKDNDVTSEEIVEKKELQSKTIESAVEKNRIESEVTQANSEN
ncbi:hypothetical protein M0804_015243 [Polistes exclamans]|nr:hypothetical protein M0804_015243 [Polistes exclamans]